MMETQPAFKFNRINKSYKSTLFTKHGDTNKSNPSTLVHIYMDKEG